MLALRDASTRRIPPEILPSVRFLAVPNLGSRTLPVAGQEELCAAFMNKSRA